MKRLLVAAALVTGLVFVLPSTASADVVTSCQGVMSGADNPNLEKSLVSVELKAGTTNTWILTYRVESTRPAGTDRLRDCVFFDQGGNRQYDGEPFVGSTDDKDTTFLPMTGGSYAIVTTEVTGSGTVCDRAARSGTDTSGMGYTDKSNLLCTPLEPTPPIPEVPFSALLPLAGLAAVAGLVMFRRRSVLTAPVA